LNTNELATVNPAVVLAVAAYNIARNWGDTVKLDVVQQWIATHANRSDYGRGYIGNSLPRGRVNAFAELRREAAVGGVKIIASIYFDERQGAAATQTWGAKRMDSKLEKLFGHNLRVRFDI